MRKIFAVIASVVLAGCAGTSIVVGTVRAPISPAMVKIYVDPPKKFEKIAIIEASSKGSLAFTGQGKMDVMMERLKEEAAKVGANGILLGSSGSQQSNGMLLVPAGKTAIGMPIEGISKTGSGMAIFVTEE